MPFDFWENKYSCLKNNIGIANSVTRNRRKKWTNKKSEINDKRIKGIAGKEKRSHWSIRSKVFA